MPGTQGYAVVSCHVERPQDDEIWGRYRRLLERTDLPVDEVGHRAGYQEPAAFRRLFKRITNMAPADYRRKCQTPFVDALGGG